VDGDRSLRGRPLGALRAEKQARGRLIIT
jgi:hypothetical protein